MSKYIQKIDPYYNKSFDSLDNNQSVGYKVITSLVSSLEKKGHVKTYDNWFISLILFFWSLALEPMALIEREGVVGQVRCWLTKVKLWKPFHGGPSGGTCTLHIIWKPLVDFITNSSQF